MRRPYATSVFATVVENNGMSVLTSVSPTGFPAYQNHTRVGQALGNTATVIQGAFEIIGGLGVAFGGGVGAAISAPLCATGIGCFVPASSATISVTGLLTAAHGTFVIGNTFYNVAYNQRGSSRSGNTNPYKGTVDKDVIVVDEKGNAIPVKQGQKLEGSSDGKFVQVKDSAGKPTGDRLDGGGHPKHQDPLSKAPHAHRVDSNGKVITKNGNPHLPIK